MNRSSNSFPSSFLIYKKESYILYIKKERILFIIHVLSLSIPVQILTNIRNNRFERTNKPIFELEKATQWRNKIFDREEEEKRARSTRYNKQRYRETIERKRTSEERYRRRGAWSQSKSTTHVP